MEEFEARVMRELEVLKSVSAKLEGISLITDRLDTLDAKFEEQVQRIDSVQAKVNLTMTSLGEVRQEQVAATRATKQASVTLRAAGDGIIHPTPPPQFPSSAAPQLGDPRYIPGSSLNTVPASQQFDPGKRTEEHGGRKPWMPKMDFPRFDGSDARIWIDGCESYFLLYDIPVGFKLKEHIPDHTPVFKDIPVTLDLAGTDTVPELILDRKMVKRGNSSQMQVLIQWSHQLPTAATWEDYETLKLRFPEAPAWGHAGSQGEAIVSTVDHVPTDTSPEA
ncbi:hypothetical protein QYE76_017404 [Lolium multiflorum]|uniref:Chromo domain-containing protein n=1 Tax=Lolium multiflorum TaxID=4521 RepID=A0AAD8Q424_LOLMU|nr:hypothetical protein QYE76_017404 [Lolium multiflorum]